MKYKDLNLEEKRNLYKSLLEVFSERGLTLKEADKKIESLSLDEKLELIKDL